MTERKKPELLAPAKNLEILKTSIRYGADAVYLGGEAYGLRANADNFSREEMIEAVRYAHERGVKIYITANIFAHNGDIDGVREYFRELDQEVRPDAVLIADPGIFAIAKEELHDIELHVSTQANNTNYMSARFWYEQGAKRIVTARELSLREIQELREKIPEDMDIETFIHGAMCISYSGRCLLSNYFTGRDANRGECTHPCRWKYALMEETRPGQYFPVEENERGTYIMNSKDLCMIDHVPELLSSGIDSLKIEGRMKTALYVAAVVRTYRKAIDDCFASEEKYKENLPLYDKEIRSCTYRDFTTGFFFGKPSDEDQIYDNNTYHSGSIYLGTIESVDENGYHHLMQKNKFSVGETIRIMKPDMNDREVKVLEILDEDGNPMESASHASQHILVRLSDAAEPMDLISRQEEEV